MRKKVADLQNIAREMIGDRLYLKHDEMLSLNENIRMMGPGVNFRCFMAFVYRTYFQTCADLLTYRNFITSKKVFDKFEEYLKDMKLATPYKIQHDWMTFEIYYELYGDMVKPLLDEVLDISPLFRFVMLDTLDRPEKERFRGDAVLQLKENPFYIGLQPEQLDHYPIQEEDL